MRLKAWARGILGLATGQLRVFVSINLNTLISEGEMFATDHKRSAPVEGVARKDSFVFIGDKVVEREVLSRSK